VIAVESQAAALRAALRLHPVVVLLGARGTGKTLIADAVVAQLESSGVQVVRLDAGLAENSLALNQPLAAMLKCSPTDLSVDAMGADDVVRVVIDNCHEFHTRAWWPYLQEQWRALLSASASRGKVGLLLIGRPLFRHVAGGSGSPLLNIGTTVLVRPLNEEEVVEAAGVEAQVAKAVLRKTGGHPRLTVMLAETIEGDLRRIGAAIADFTEQNQRYLTRLAEDHTLGGMAMLADLLAAEQPVAEAALTDAHFGSAYADAQETLADLAASGMIVRENGSCAIAAQLLKQTPAVRDYLRAPSPRVPTNAPDCHAVSAAFFYTIENRLREIIVEALGAVDRTWWQTRVPSTYIGEAESRRTAELKSATTPTRGAHPIMFLSLGELFEIVLTRENWDQVFAVRVRRTPDVVRTASRDLLAVRNKIAHDRPVSEDDVELARNAAQRLGLEPNAEAAST
jgi:hypothetical protein